MNNMTKVKAGDIYTEEIPTPGGIRQGDSQFLFNLSMDRIICRESIIIKYGIPNGTE